MKFKEVLLVFFLFVLISLVFFYKTIIYGYIPFPGDLLIAEYSPWKSYSYLGYTPGSYPHKAQYFDVIRQLYPWKTLSISLLKNGQFPLWNPYNFSGTPLFANIQSAVLYPFNIFYFVFPQITSWTLLVLMQPLLASFFTYLYAREIGIKKLGSFLSAVAYGYSLFMGVFLEYNTMGHVILWLPILLYLSETMLKQVRLWKIVCFVLAFCSSIFAGHIQLSMFLLIFASVYIICRIIFIHGLGNIKKIRISLMFLGMSVLSLGVSAVQLLPTIELIRLSARIAQDYNLLIEKLLIQPYQLILFLSPDIFGNPATRNYLIPDTYPGNALYIGLVPFLFSLTSLAEFRKNYYIKYFSIVGLFLIIIFTRSPITELFYRFEIPLFSTGSPTNAIFLLSFCLSILSGLGFEIWNNRVRSSFWKFILFFSALFTVICIFAYINKGQTININNFIYSTGILFIFFVLLAISNFWKRKKVKHVVNIFFLFITVFDLFYFFQKFNPFVSSALFFPEARVLSYLYQNIGINRLWGYGFASIEPNFTTQYQLFSPDGYDPLYPKRYGEFTQASVDGRVKIQFTTKTRSDALVVPGFGETDFASNIYRLRILDMLGVKYILDRVENGSTEKTFPKDRFKLIYEQDGWRIFENNAALSRLLLASDYKVFKNIDEFEKIFFSKEFDPSKTVLLEETPKGIEGETLNDSSRQQAGLNHLSTVRLLSYEPNGVVVEVATPNSRILFLSDTYFPGWKAFIDGKLSQIYRANYSFRAVVVPEGEHKVVFQYKPESFSLGLKVSIISLGSIVVFALWASKNKLIYEK